MSIVVAAWIAALAAGLPASAAGPQETAPPQTQSGTQPGTPTPPQQETAAELYQRGMAAYLSKDYLGFYESLSRAAQLAPGHPAILYRLAAASALVGNHDEGIRHLERLAAMKVAQDVTTADFDALRETPRFQAVAAAMRDLRAPVGRSRHAFRLSERDLIPDGLAHDPVSGDFFVGSVHHRKILRVTKRGKAAVFAGERPDGLGAVLGMKVDPARRILWVCSTGLPQMIGATAQERGRAALHRYDLRSGALEKTFPLGGGEEGHNCNDLTLTARGEVLVSDAASGEILLLSPGAGELKVFVETGRLKSPQGLALTPDGRHLIIADYATGLMRLDVTSRELTPLEHPPDLALQGIDGLVWHGDGLTAIQNGITPHRVVRLTVPGGAFDRVVSSRILEMNNPVFDEPTLGVVVDDVLYYIANSQWARFEPDGKIFPLSRLAEPVILKLKLE